VAAETFKALAIEGAGNAKNSAGIGGGTVVVLTIMMTTMDRSNILPPFIPPF
jgi:hypothetical protein